MQQRLTGSATTRGTGTEMLPLAKLSTPSILTRSSLGEKTYDRVKLGSG